MPVFLEVARLESEKSQVWSVPGIHMEFEALFLVVYGSQVMSSWGLYRVLHPCNKLLWVCRLGGASHGVWLGTAMADSPCSQGICRISCTRMLPQLTAVHPGLAVKPHLGLLKLWIGRAEGPVSGESEEASSVVLPLWSGF